MGQLCDSGSRKSLTIPAFSARNRRVASTTQPTSTSSTAPSLPRASIAHSQLELASLPSSVLTAAPSVCLRALLVVVVGMFGVPSAVAAAPQRAPKPSDTVRDSALWESLPRRISCNSIRYERGKFLGKVRNSLDRTPAPPIAAHLALCLLGAGRFRSRVRDDRSLVEHHLRLQDRQEGLARTGAHQAQGMLFLCAQHSTRAVSCHILAHSLTCASS